MSLDRTDPLATEHAAGTPALTRRRVLQGAATVGVIGVAGTVLAACGGGNDPGTTPSSSSGGGSAGGEGIATTADVPVSGGVILQTEKIVITQPADGDFKAFTAVCTHMGCLVGSVTDNVIKCPCHGSTYDASTGEVIGGPAPRPLAAVDITVDGDQITLA
jgi:Rieske Fe-S protein